MEWIVVCGVLFVVCRLLSGVGCLLCIVCDVVCRLCGNGFIRWAVSFSVVYGFLFGANCLL